MEKIIRTTLLDLITHPKGNINIHKVKGLRKESFQDANQEDLFNISEKKENCENHKPTQQFCKIERSILTRTDKLILNEKPMDLQDKAEKYLQRLGSTLYKQRFESVTSDSVSTSLSPLQKKRRRVKKSIKSKRKMKQNSAHQYLHRLSVDLTSINKALDLKYFKQGGLNIIEKGDNDSIQSSSEERDKVNDPTKFFNLDKSSNSDERTVENLEEEQFKINLVPQKRVAFIDEEVKMFRNSRINSINEIEDEDSDYDREKEAEKTTANNLLQPDDFLQGKKLFERRKRFMSNIDKLNLNKEISPKKLKGKKDRKTSISDTEFNAFFSAFEQHSSHLSVGKANYDSYCSTTDAISTKKGHFFSPTKMQKTKTYSKNKPSFSSLSSANIPQNDTCEYEYSEFKFLKPIGLKKGNSIKLSSTNSFKSNDLNSIVDALKELENEIS